VSDTLRRRAAVLLFPLAHAAMPLAHGGLRARSEVGADADTHAMGIGLVLLQAAGGVLAYVLLLPWLSARFRSEGAGRIALCAAVAVTLSLLLTWIGGRLGPWMEPQLGGRGGMTWLFALPLVAPAVALTVSAATLLTKRTSSGSA
jgi:hypothetical protein